MSSNGVNKVILIGNLGVDPEVRETQNGSVVVTLKVATTESWRDRESGDLREHTEWHRVVLFGKLGKVARDYLTKGSKVYILGRFRTRKWTDGSGADRYTTEVLADEMQMLGGGRSRSDGRGYSGDQQQPHRTRQAQGGIDEDLPDF